MSVRTKRIAVLNHYDHVLDALTDLFQDAGFEVVAKHVADLAYDPGIGLEFLRQHQPDVAVVDLAPPWQRSKRFLDGLQAIRPGICVVVTTTDVAGMEQALGPLQAIPILPRPFGFQELLDAVRNHCGVEPPRGDAT